MTNVDTPADAIHQTHTTSNGAEPTVGRLAGKVAVVTGGGSGIGRAICRRFAQEGADVVVTSRTPEHVAAVAAEIEAVCGRRPLALALDVGDSASVQAAIAQVVDRYGRIDVLSNNAYFESARSPQIADISDDEWEKALLVGLTGTFRVCRAALPHMPPGSAILNMAAVGAFFAFPGEGLLGTVKAGLVQFTRQLAFEGAPRGIRANCVCPGIVDTPSVQSYLDRVEDAATLRRAYDAASPMGRIATAEEIANSVLFLVSDESSYITGTALTVDGGMTLAPGADTSGASNASV